MNTAYTIFGVSAPWKKVAVVVVVVLFFFVLFFFSEIGRALAWSCLSQLVSIQISE